MIDTGTAELSQVFNRELGIKPINTHHAEFGDITRFNDGSYFYEFKDKNNLKVLLTPEGRKKQKQLTRNQIKKIHEDKDLGVGEKIDNKRSDIMDYSGIGIVEKSSTLPESRLGEFIRMRKNAQIIAKAQSGGDFRLKVPEYYAFASWEENNVGKQAIFMSRVSDQRLTDMSVEDAKNTYPDLAGVLDQARNAGVIFTDQTANNFFVRKSGDKNTYVMIDQE